jgi:hypothetical protein
VTAAPQTEHRDRLGDAPETAAGSRRVLFARLPDPVVALLVAVLLVVVAYPEVVFLGGSLSPVGMNGLLDRNFQPQTAQVYPNTTTDSPGAGVQDVGARLWQLVPATKFVHDSIAHNESVSWNPYSAAGSYGPETLNDIKLSPFVLAVALFGASATAFTFVALLFEILALYCLQRFIVRSLGMSHLAALAGCLVFMLAGFGASDFSSQVGAPYVLFPVVLYTLVEFLRRGGALRLFVAVGAYAAFWLTWFVPVQLLMAPFIHGVALVVDASNTPRRSGETTARRARHLIARQLVVPLIALAVTAFAWLPVVDALRHGSGDVSSYADRSFTNSGKLRVLKIASPWLTNTQAWVGYIGIAPVMLAAAAWSRTRGRDRRLLTFCIVAGAFALALHAQLPGVELVDHLPLVRSIRPDYWSAVAASASTVAVAIAVDVVARRGADVVAAALVGIAFAVVIVGAWGVNILLGWGGVPILGVCAALALVAALIALARASRRVSHRRIVMIATVALLGLELFSYQNHTRYKRFDWENRPPAYVSYVQQHVGDERVLTAGRGAMYPEWGTVFGIRQVETINGFQIPTYRTFFNRYVNPGNTDLFLTNYHVPFRAEPRALNVLSVRYLVVDTSETAYNDGVRANYPLAFNDPAAGVSVYRNDNAFDRVYVSPALAPLVAPQQWSQTVTQTRDPRLLADARTAGIPSSASSRAGGTARIGSQSNTSIHIEVNATNPGVLVVTNSDQSNWTATVNGRRAHLGLVNDVVSGVVVPRGASTVVISYHSSARTLGGRLSLLTILLLLLVPMLVAVARRRRKQRSQTQ